MDSNKDNKKVNPRILYTFLAIGVILVACASAVYLYFTISEIEDKAKELPSLTNYSLSSLASNDSLKNEYPLWKSLGDMFGYNSWVEKEIQKSKDQREKLTIPYNNFLRFLYTPSLNIWKSMFSDNIDTSLVGEKYLLNNPYDDIELIQKRTNFFKDMGVVDQYNTISDISLGSIETVEGGLFYLPITVQFETPDRRSFLLLVSKLSMTSYAENISLINEYMFYLRETIKENKSQEIKNILSSADLPSLIKTEDQVIGYSLYRRIKEDFSNNLIDKDIINKAISKAAWCTDQAPQECLYMFREKYRPVPYLAYGITRTNGNIVEGLRQFFVNMPPLISIDSFSFDPKTQTGKKTRDVGYKGSISIKVYGKDLGPDEVSEIGDRLGILCFQNKTPISPSYSISILNRLIEQLGQQDAINAKRSAQLNEMSSYITRIDAEYQGLSNYKKVVRLFEIYRTLQEGNACDLIEQDLPTVSQQKSDAKIKDKGQEKNVFIPENIATTSGTVTPIRLDVQESLPTKSNKKKETITTTGQVGSDSINTQKSPTKENAKSTQDTSINTGTQLHTD